MPGTALKTRLAALDWPSIQTRLADTGSATAGPLLTPAECAGLIALYGDDARFRSRVVMQRHGFGRGEYKYFGDPLPAIVAALRETLYARLAPLANRWAKQLGRGAAAAYPKSLSGYLKQCHAAGQTRPTPLMLRYRAGDYNCLHQDLYGDLTFPIQATILLSKPGQEFAGGEFVLVEQRPRMQSRPDVVALGQGEAVFFAVNERPMAGKRGTYRVRQRHGVSQIRAGERVTLGVIFHDAR